MSIEIHKLCKSYGDHVVLDHLSLTFREGSCNVIMGPSGCGKTTLLRILMGFETADSGQIQGMPSRLSAVFQEDRLCEDFSALENISLVLRKKVPADEIIRHLEAIGLTGNYHQPVREYSGGMKRRVAIVRAVMAESDLIILDEPFKGLDLTNRDLALNYFREKTQGKTSILVTHDPTEAEMLGNLLFRL